MAVPENDEAVTPLELRRAAMDLLARREHSAEELSQKLQKRWRGRPVVSDDLEGVLQSLALEGLQSDERYAVARARQLAGRGCGPTRIREALRQQGVDHYIEGALEQACAESDDWLAHAASVYAKKYQGAPIVGDFNSRQKEKAKRLRFLQYRGFDAAVSRLLVNADDKGNALEE